MSEPSQPPLPRTGSDLRREVLRLALPAFVALSAEPVFLLVDSAIVGHLGTTALAGLGIATTILLTLVGVCVFLAYATTSVVARLLGAGDRAGALSAGIDGSWLAGILGMLLAVLLLVFAGPLIGAFGAGPAVTDQALAYLRPSSAGVPAMLLVLATTGVLRGFQDTLTPLVVAVIGFGANAGLNWLLVYPLSFGIAGSAWGTVIAQWFMAGALLTVLIRYAGHAGVPLRAHPRRVLAAAGTGVPLLIRTLALRAVLVLTAWVAAAMGELPLAAHQVALTIWVFLTFVLDALAIAAQAMTGRALGAGDLAGARAATTLMVRWGALSGGVLLVVVILARPWLPGLFTNDPAIDPVLTAALGVVALSMPVTGVFCVIDGVLIGAGDGRWLAWSMVGLLTAYAPIALGIRAFREGLLAPAGASTAAVEHGQVNAITWLWVGFTAFLALRATVLWLRVRTEAWLVVGATP